MDAVEFEAMNHEIKNLISQIAGKQCCRKKVGRMRSLSLGFGGKNYHENSRLNDDFYGEWEVGTYHCAWRVMKGKKIVCGSQDVVDSIEELNVALNKIELGHLTSLQQVNDLDIRLEFDNDVIVDFLATTSDEDECFHVFCPGKLTIVFSTNAGWEVGASNKPWKQTEKGA